MTPAAVGVEFSSFAETRQILCPSPQGAHSQNSKLFIPDVQHTEDL
jgi:hypothetical protein